MDPEGTKGNSVPIQLAGENRRFMGKGTKEHMVKN